MLSNKGNHINICMIVKLQPCKGRIWNVSVHAASVCFFQMVNTNDFNSHGGMTTPVKNMTNECTTQNDGFGKGETSPTIGILSFEFQGCKLSSLDLAWPKRNGKTNLLWPAGVFPKKTAWHEFIRDEKIHARLWVTFWSQCLVSGF